MRVFMIRAFEEEWRVAPVVVQGERDFQDQWSIEPLLPKSDTWWEEARRLIDSCTVAVWMVSFRSADSEPCAREAAYALARGKQLFLWLMDPVGQLPQAEHPNVCVVASPDTSVEQGVRAMHRQLGELQR